MTATDAILREAVLGKVPKDGTAIGNGALLAALAAVVEGVAEADYRRVRDALVAEGVLAKGGGKGSSTRCELARRNRRSDRLWLRCSRY